MEKPNGGNLQVHRKLTLRLRTLMANYSDDRGRRLTLQELSQGTGISMSTLSHLCNDRQRLLDRSVLERLCDFFDCGLHDLVRLEPIGESTEQGVPG